MSDIHVAHEGGDRFTVSIRGHTVLIDQPVEDGGTDEGPTPSELFVASLAGCVGYFAGRYLARHAIDPSGLAVDASYRYSDGPPSRVSEVGLRVTLPAAFPVAKMEALSRVIHGCTVHESLRQPPEIRVDVEVGDPVP